MYLYYETVLQDVIISHLKYQQEKVQTCNAIWFPGQTTDEAMGFFQPEPGYLRVDSYQKQHKSLYGFGAGL